jgi:tetratricopeptide (TPR) repeat protein
MKRIYFNLLFILTISLTISCNGVKSLTKKGDKAFEKEQYEKAVNFYFTALNKDKNYNLAKSGLKKGAQRLVNNDLDLFFKSKNFGENRKAIYHFRDAKKLKDRCEAINVSLDIPIQYVSDYDLLVNNYVESQYEKGMNLLQEEAFKESENIFKEIKLLKANYKDVEDLQKVAEFEPKYRLAVSYLQNDKFRAAYTQFKKVPTNYKDTKEKIELCLEAGTITIGFVDFKNATRNKGGEAAISAYLFNELTQLNNPFIKIVDRSLTSTIINEQILGLSGQTSESTSANAGELIGAKAILSGSLITFSKKSDKLRVTNKKAWFEKLIKKYNKETEKYYYETEYSKVKYKEYYGQNQVSLGFQYQLTSTETGEILLTGIVNLNNFDRVNYASSDVNFNKLVPGNWKYENKAHKDDVISDSVTKKRDLRNLFKSKKTLLTIDQLKDILYKKTAVDVSQKINNYNPENE